jgi:hypothetical protein
MKGGGCRGVREDDEEEGGGEEEEAMGEGKGIGPSGGEASLVQRREAGGG